MKKPFVVGIAGGSASGKSTFCDIIEKQFIHSLVKVFHMDDYFKPADERPFSKAPITGKMYVDDNHPDTIDFVKLYTDLDCSLESEFDLIIVEGLFVLWDDLIYSKLDLKIFIDCKPDERIIRRLRRNTAWGISFDEVSDVYLDLVRYRHDEFVEPTKWKADLILNGSNLTDYAVNIILDLIHKNLYK